jgi:large subunit ribosomal protein L9
MKVILKENIENLGKRGDIVEVAAGYGRNYLIPRRLALQVTPTNMKMVEMEQQALRKKYEQERMSHQGLIEKINQARLSFVRKTAEKDVIFGSVSSVDIKEALAEKGMEIDKKRILLEEPIKRLGNYTVPIKVFHQEKAEIKIEVIGEEASAKEEEKEVPPAQKKEEPSEEKKEEVVEETGVKEEDKVEETEVKAEEKKTSEEDRNKGGEKE